MIEAKDGYLKITGSKPHILAEYTAVRKFVLENFSKKEIEFADGLAVKTDDEIADEVKKKEEEYFGGKESLKRLLKAIFEED